MSRSITSIPLAVRVATAASRTHGPLGRLSRPMTTFNVRGPEEGPAAEPLGSLSFSHTAKAAAI